MTDKQLTAIKRIRQYRQDILAFVREQFKIEPDLWQAKALIAFANSNELVFRLSLQACAGPGKLNHDDTILYTPSGIKRHGDLKVGDIVFAEDGSPTQIVATKRWENITFYKVTFSDGADVICGGEHLWKVQSNHFVKFKDWNVAETKELFDLGVTRSYNQVSSSKIRTVRRFKIPVQGPAQFTENDNDIDLPIHPYLMGVWLGDGCRKTSAIVKDDDEPFRYIESLGYDVTRQKKHDSGGQRYTITGLIAKLKALGISDCYSGQRYIPEIYKQASIRQRKELLMGLLDTDGRIKTNGMMDFHSTSKQLINDFVFIARSLGQYTHTRRVVDTHKETSDCYAASIRTDFNPFRIKRKAERWTSPPTYRMHRFIESIEKLDQGSGQCIEVAHKSHCYLVNDFIVTHNSALLAWSGWWFLLTQGERGSHPKGAALAITQDNLKDNLWAELSKWQQVSPICSRVFTWTKQRIFANDHPETWFLSARSFSKSANSEEQGRTLSGIHSKYVLFLIDESGDIPETVMKSVDQAFSTSDMRCGRVIQAGNPTSHTGMLYSASKSNQWETVRITGDPDDPLRSPRINIEWAKAQIEKYGRDDPWVMSYILGRFPESGINTLLSVDEIEDAMNRTIQESDYEFAQKRLGIDTARFGTDSTIIFPRQGLRAFNYVEMRGARSNDIAARVMSAKVQWGSEIEFVDGTGGYGSGVVDSLIQAGGRPFEIMFSGKATNPRYYNKRAEMWFLMAEWVKRGGVLPRCQVLKKELASPTYSFRDGKFILEAKEQIKSRLGFSTDRSDGLALTFSLPEMPSESSPQRLFQKPGALHDYDPLP